MAPTKRKPGRPRTEHGRDAEKITFRVSDAEMRWAEYQAARFKVSIPQLARNQLFRGMPGYKPEV